MNKMKKLATLFVSLALVVGTFFINSVAANKANKANQDSSVNASDNLILKHSADLFQADKTDMASHASHASHSSHASHASHASHSSGY